MSPSKKSPNIFDRKPYLLALILTFLLVAWMASGALNAESTKTGKSEADAKLPSVEVTRFNAQSVSRSIELYGRTEPERIVELGAEVDGRVSKILVEEGQFVEEGQTIVLLAIEDRIAQVELAEALVKQREIEFKGMQSLVDKGLQGESSLAEAKAALVSAKASLARAKIQLDKSTIKAPFSGFLNHQKIELGSFVNKGQSLFSIVDLDPLIVSANVTEDHIQNLSADTKVEVKLVDGTLVDGKVSYVASVSEKGTNTFPIEVEIANPNQKYRAGVSTEVTLFYAQTEAIKVTPALLSLDPAGNLGVKTVKDNVVTFTPIDLIKAEQDGVWLGGFDREIDVITLGQGFVKIGDKVNVSYKQ